MLLSSKGDLSAIPENIIEFSVREKQTTLFSRVFLVIKWYIFTCIFSGYRQEECSPGGCLMELCVQLAIIFVGKQFVLSIWEYYLPLLWKLYHSAKLAASGISADTLKKKAPQCVRDFKLTEWGSQGLFYEYLEMGNFLMAY